jgi:DNA polymerase-3 subunit beta
LPKKGLVEVKRALDTAGGTCDIAVKTPYFFLRSGEVTLAIKLIDAQFPPYEAVIPKANDKVLEVSRPVLADALKRAQLMSSETRGVRLSLASGTLRVTSDNPDLGEVKEEIEAQYDGAPVTLGVNPKYMLELLAQIESERVHVELCGELDPLLLRPVGDDGHLGVIMPMRI